MVRRVLTTNFDSFVGERMLLAIQNSLEIERKTKNTLNLELYYAKAVNDTENKLGSTVVEITKKLQTTEEELENKLNIDSERRIELQTQIKVHTMNLNLLGVKHTTSNRVSELHVKYSLYSIYLYVS